MEKAGGNYAGAIKKGGRPEKLLSDLSPEETVETLAGFGVSQIAIAKTLGISDDTLRCNPELHAAWKRGHSKACVDIHRAQYSAGVEKGNVAMLIWLGKQHLGQSDKVDLKTESQVTISPEDRVKQAVESLARIRADRNARS